MNTRIVGLGNSILSDDGVGIYAVREIARRLEGTALSESVDIVETEVGGFALMELMAGWKRVILIDSIRFDGLASGTVVRIDPGDLRTSLRIRSVHDINLPTALELGRLLGLEMPGELIIYGIQAEDPFTLGESLTAGAEHGLREVVAHVLEEISDSRFKI